MAVNSESPDILKGRWEKIFKSYLIKFTDDDPGGALQNLIEDICEKLVGPLDEYDYPVSHYIDHNSLAKVNPEVFSSFYVNLKDMDEFLRFVMATGGARYAMRGLSARLNQLVDVSFDPKYATISRRRARS
ncbi:MAG: AAA family ATPase [Deltaproteobacteria bacterium]|jgi:hypothetical protein|nr:AAA family ATPase [Deltaproteobacteria bacterium]